MVPALGVDEDLARAGRHVLAVADDLGIGVTCGHGAADDAWVAVMEAAHAVVGVHEDAGASRDRGKRLLVGGVGMPDGALHAHRRRSRYVFDRTRALGRESALADDAMGGALPSLEDLDLWVDEEGGVLGTDVLHREEGSLEEDALDARACEVGTTRVGRLEDRRAACAEVVHALGEGRREPGGGAATSELDAGDVHALGILVGGGVVEEAVDVRVHETGGHPLARRVDDVTLGTVRGERAELSIDDGQIAWAEDPARQYEPLRIDRDGCHE